MWVKMVICLKCIKVIVYPVFHSKDLPLMIGVLVNIGVVCGYYWSRLNTYSAFLKTSKYTEEDYQENPSQHLKGTKFKWCVLLIELNYLIVSADGQWHARNYLTFRRIEEIPGVSITGRVSLS